MKRQMPKWLFWTLAIVIVFVAFKLSESAAGGRSTADRDFNSKETKRMAKVMSERLISQRLKAPATASFTDDPTIVFEGDSTFEIKGYVDSQNSFGAMLRTNYVARIKFIAVHGEQEEWQMLSFETK